MKSGKGIKIRLGRTLPVVALMTAVLVAMPVMAQAPVPPPQLDQLVKRIALYPDPLLAQVLTASTFWDVIPEAAAWANQHSMLHGDQLAAAIEEDHLPWDPSVLALLPFPQVLNMMAGDPGWTQALGNAVLVQRPDTGEKREVLIYMNNPLRYAGETFYQASWDKDDHGTVLQVVHNPSWLTPYFSCVLVGAGLVWQFLTHLLGFTLKRKTPSVSAPPLPTPASAGLALKQTKV